jgi:hypothetical protein
VTAWQVQGSVISSAVAWLMVWWVTLKMLPMLLHQQALKASVAAECGTSTQCIHARGAWTGAAAAA